MRRTRLPALWLIRARDLLLARRDIEVIDRAVEQLQRRDRLVVGHLVARFVDAGKAEVAVLARLAVLDAVDHHGDVVGGLELGGVGEFQGEGDGLAAEPVADVVGVAVDQGDADGAAVEDGFEVVEEVGPDEVAGLLESEVDIVIRVECVVGVDTE